MYGVREVIICVKNKKMKSKKRDDSLFLDIPIDKIIPYSRLYKVMDFLFVLKIPFSDPENERNE